MIDFKSFNDINKACKATILEDISALFMISHESFVDYQAQYFEPQILSGENCKNPIMHGQYGLFTQLEIKQYQILGFYSGIYATSLLDLHILASQFDPLLIGRYGNACFKDGFPVICGHYNGNYMTVINDWRPFEWYNMSQKAQDASKAQTYNANSVVIRSGDYYFIAYVATKNMTVGTQIITDYGVDYWNREEALIRA